MRHPFRHIISSQISHSVHAYHTSHLSKSSKESQLTLRHPLVDFLAPVRQILWVLVLTIK